MKNKYKIGVIGLGYVGLPLAVAMAKKFDVIGFDINKKRVDEIKKSIDSTLEIDSAELNSVILESESSFSKCHGLCLSCDFNILKSCKIYLNL